MLIGYLVEEVSENASIVQRFLQLINDAVEEHSLALSRVTLNLEQLLILIIAPLMKIRVFEYLDV